MLEAVVTEMHPWGRKNMVASTPDFMVNLFTLYEGSKLMISSNGNSSHVVHVASGAVEITYQDNSLRGGPGLTVNLSRGGRCEVQGERRALIYEIIGTVQYLK